MAKTASPIKLPKTLAGMADRLYELKDLKRDAQAVVDKIDAEKSAIEQYLIDNLPKSDASGVAGKLARVTIVVKNKPSVEDWDAFWAKFDKKKDRDLLQKRLSEPAVEARWEAGKEVPGVVVFPKPTISLNKV